MFNREEISKSNFKLSKNNETCNLDNFIQPVNPSSAAKND